MICAISPTNYRLTKQQTAEIINTMNKARREKSRPIGMPQSKIKRAKKAKVLEQESILTCICLAPDLIEIILGRFLWAGLHCTVLFLLLATDSPLSLDKLEKDPRQTILSYLPESGKSSCKNAPLSFSKF